MQPYRTGGATIAFVNNARHDYLTDLKTREEGGTPNIIGDIGVALALIMKDALGHDRYGDGKTLGVNLPLWFCRIRFFDNHGHHVQSRRR